MGTSEFIISHYEYYIEIYIILYMKKDFLPVAYVECNS